MISSRGTRSARRLIGLPRLSGKIPTSGSGTSAATSHGSEISILVELCPQRPRRSAMTSIMAPTAGTASRPSGAAATSGQDVVLVILDRV